MIYLFELSCKIIYTLMYILINLLSIFTFFSFKHILIKTHPCDFITGKSKEDGYYCENIFAMWLREIKYDESIKINSDTLDY